MRKVKTDIQHNRFTLMVENPMLRQKAHTPDQIREVIERYARDHGMTVERASQKAKLPNWIPVGVGLHRDAAHALQRKSYPGIPYRIVGSRSDYTPLEVKRERNGEGET